MSTKHSLALTLILAVLLSPLNLAAARTAKPAGFAAGTESKSPDFALAPTAATWYVNHAATGANNGSSWANAYTRLQSALTSASAGDQIWVAQGVYTPTNTSDRTATFTLKASVALYGGFDPANGAGSWAKRNWQAHITVLSGDLDGDDITDAHGVVVTTTNIVGDNAYHVLSSNGLDASAKLDGFVITGGKADGSYPHNNGGGMYNNDSSPSVQHVVFSANLASYGGGVYSYSSSPSLVNVTFIANQATIHGGGMYNINGDSSLVNVTFSANRADQGGGMFNDNSSPRLVNVTFSANQANSNGGGMYNRENSPSLVNVTFSANRADYGGGIYNYYGNLTISNSILWGNSATYGAQVYNHTASAPTIRYSDVQGGCPSGSTCDHLINADPLFIRPPSPGSDATWGTADDDYGNLRLQRTSPAIDAGNNTYLPADTLDLDGDGNTSERIPFDLDYLARFVDIPWIIDSGIADLPGYPFIVDMGAYEAFAWRLYLPVIVQ